tara:strand:+ start:1534 stop:2166 length:633 start_codon:yes stop_codon:yes gene_type:complete
MNDQPKPEMMINSQGHHVPINLVKPEDLMKHDTAVCLVDKSKVLQAQMLELKELAFGEVFAAKALILEKYGAKVGGQKGNITISSYDGTKSVKISVQEHIHFGPELEAAKALIDQCIEEWSEGGNQNIRALVDHAFQVNKEGSIDTGRVLGLRSVNMKSENGDVDPNWVKAMGAIADAVKVKSTASYVRFYEENPSTGKLETISLDFAKL